MKETGIRSGVGKPGNRAKDLPIRRAEWEGLTINEIISNILDSSPDIVLHADEIAGKVYEVQSTIDLDRVKKNLVTSLRRGAKKGMWQALKRNKYKSKLAARQEMLVQA